MILRGILLVSLLGLLATPATVAGEAAGDDVVMFEGMHREAVAVLLGPPHKVKRSRGQETLIYTLRRVGEDYLPSAQERLFVVPGHGTCIAVLGTNESFDETTTLEPPRTDKQGRPISSGPTSTRSRTINLGERPDPPAADRGKVGRKLKLKLILAGDHVRSWSAGPSQEFAR